MDYFGINSPLDLPKLKEIFNEAAVDPTNIRSQTTDEATDLTDSIPLIVTENGELLEGNDNDNNNTNREQEGTGN
jgi:segregation and condensation protein B